MTTYAWFKPNQKTGLNSAPRTRVQQLLVFLLQWVSSAVFLLASFTHASRSLEHNHKLQNQVLERVANGNAKGENMILHPDWTAEKSSYFRAAFLPFPLVS